MYRLCVVWFFNGEKKKKQRKSRVLVIVFVWSLKEEGVEVVRKVFMSVVLWLSELCVVTWWLMFYGVVLGFVKEVR